MRRLHKMVWYDHQIPFQLVPCFHIKMLLVSNFLHYHHSDMTFFHSPPHRQLLAHRCSQYFIGGVLAGECNRDMQEHLKETKRKCFHSTSGWGRPVSRTSFFEGMQEFKIGWDLLDQTCELLYLTTTTTPLNPPKKKQFDPINGSQLAKMKKSIPDMSLP